MAATLISFENIPKFGFAHHLYTEETQQIQNDLQPSFVLMYIKSGHLTVHIYDRTFEAPAGSVLTLFRHVPFRIQSTFHHPQDYCSIQIFTDFTFGFLDDNEDFPTDFAGLALPVVIPPGSDAELIKKDMYAIVSNLSVSRQVYGFNASAMLGGVLSRMDMLYRQKQHRGKNVSLYWEYRIKRYLADHMRQTVSLEQLADAMDKTPNYLNSVFSKATGVSIHQYMNREKMRFAASLMETQGLNFREACENVGIVDLSHGYRLFKRYMGVTPKEYIDAERQITGG